MPLISFFFDESLDEELQWRVPIGGLCRICSQTWPQAWIFTGIKSVIVRAAAQIWRKWIVGNAILRSFFVCFSDATSGFALNTPR